MCAKLKTSALEALGAIGPDMWKKRQIFLGGSTLPTVDWHWGRDEDEKMFLEDRSRTEANIPTTLAREISRIAG